MPKAYIVASINVTDPDGFEEYKNAAVKVRKEAGGTLLVNGPIRRGRWLRRMRPTPNRSLRSSNAL